MAKKYRSWKFLTNRRSAAGGPPRSATENSIFWEVCQKTVAEVAARSEKLEKDLWLPDGDVPVIAAVCPESMKTCQELGLEESVVNKKLCAWRSKNGNVRNWFFLAIGARQALSILNPEEKYRMPLLELLKTRQMVVVIGADGKSSVKLIDGRIMPPEGTALINSLGNS